MLRHNDLALFFNNKDFKNLVNRLHPDDRKELEVASATASATTQKAGQNNVGELSNNFNLNLSNLHEEVDAVLLG